MKEILRIKLYYKDSLAIFKEDEGQNWYDQDKKYLQYKVLDIETSSTKIEEIRRLRENYIKRNDYLYYDSTIIRKYTKREIENAELFTMEVKKSSDALCEEIDTLYDDSCQCPICGSGGRQISPLYLKKKNYFNNREAIRTYTPEIFVSKKFVDFVNDNNLKGLSFGDIYYGKRLSNDGKQLLMEGCELNISPMTKFGVDLFNDSEDCPEYGCVYKCPTRDNLGFRCLSEVYVDYSPLISQYDFFISKQTCGLRMGTYRPAHILFCSPRMKKLIEEQHIKGFNFEIAHIVK